MERREGFQREAAAAISPFFEYPERQQQQLLHDLQRELPDRLCQDLIARAKQQRQALDRTVLEPLSRRFAEIEQASQQVRRAPDRNQALKLFAQRLRLMHPAHIARELAPALRPPDLSDYAQIVEELGRSLPHPDLAQRYTLPREGLRRLALQVVAPGEPVAHALREHGLNLQAHSDLVRSLRNEPLIAKAGRLFGQAVASALGPIVGQNLVGQLFGMDNPLAGSLELVEQGWERFRRAFDAYFEERQRRVEYLYLSLLGGLVMGIQRDLRHFGAELTVTADGRWDIIPTAARQERVRSYFTTARERVLESLRGGETEQADELATALLAQVTADPVSAKSLLGLKSVGYAAHLLHLGVRLIRARERWDLGRPEQSAAIWLEIFERYPCLVADAELAELCGEEQPLLQAGYRLAAYAEWLRESRRPDEADRLLLAQIGYVARWHGWAKKERGFPGEELSPELVHWGGVLAAYLERTHKATPIRLPMALPERRVAARNYSPLSKGFRTVVGTDSRKTELDRFLQQGVLRAKGKAVAVGTGVVGLLAGLGWTIFLFL